VLEALGASLRDSTARRTLDSALDEMQRAMTETRCALWGLRSPDRSSADLQSQISDYARSLTAMNGINYICESEGKPVLLTQTAQRELIQIAREAILNVVKHAGATTITQLISFDGRCFKMRISDNGCGWDMASSGDHGHFGLQGMRERASSLRGDCNISSEPACGTTVAVEIADIRPFLRKGTGSRSSRLNRSEAFND